MAKTVRLSKTLPGHVDYGIGLVPWPPQWDVITVPDVLADDLLLHNRAILPTDPYPYAPGPTTGVLYGGNGVPASTLGIDGDFYIDNAAHAIYGPKTSGLWGTPTTLGVGTITGQVVASTSVYALLPTSGVDSGDVAFLTADTVGAGTASAPQYPRGLYTWDGSAWTFSMAIEQPTSASAFSGATASTAGTEGIVPAPAAGEQDATLTGAGTFTGPSKSFVIAIAAALG